MRTPRVSPDIATALRLIRRGPAWSLDGSAFITPLSPLALELLRPHLKADPAARLFDLDRHDLQAAARRIVAGLGMDKWPPHDVRRTAATILDREGYSLEQIGALLATPARRDGGIHAVGQVRLAARSCTRFGYAEFGFAIACPHRRPKKDKIAITTTIRPTI